MTTRPHRFAWPLGLGLAAHGLLASWLVLAPTAPAAAATAAPKPTTPPRKTAPKPTPTPKVPKAPRAEADKALS